MSVTPLPTLGMRHRSVRPRGRPPDVTRRVLQPERRHVYIRFSYIQYTAVFCALFEIVREIKYNNDDKSISYRFGASRFDPASCEKMLVSFFATCCLKFNFTRNVI